MDLTRREFVVLAAVTLAVPAACPQPPPAERGGDWGGAAAHDELPLQGEAGECSGWH